MINDRNVTAERRIDSLHTSLPTRRTDLAVLQTCEKLASDKNLEPAVAIGVIESIFDFQPRKWFGTHPPRPAEWNTASQDSMRLALRMAESAKARADLPPALKQAIDQTAQAITEALTARGKP
jgi:hypothetical protein